MSAPAKPEEHKDKKEEAPHRAEAPHGTEGGKDKKPIADKLSKAGDAVVNGIKGLPKKIGKIGGGIWKRISAVIGSAWEATGGQVTGELGEAGKRLGYESHETGPLHAIAGAIEAVSKKVAQVVGGIVDFTVGIPGRVTGRVLRGTQNVVTGAVTGKTHKKEGGGNEKKHHGGGGHHAAA